MSLNPLTDWLFHRKSRLLTRQIFLALLAFFFPALGNAINFVVTSTGDSASTVGTLRWAITQSNMVTGPNTITFDLVSGPYVIQPLTPLPAIVQSTTIDGYSQPGASANTMPMGMYNGVILIQIDGSMCVPTIPSPEPNPPVYPYNYLYGLNFQSGASTLLGVSMTNWLGAGVMITANLCIVSGCFIGPYPDGITLGANGTGVAVLGDNTVNFGVTIGGPNIGDGNVIVGNFGPFVSPAPQGYTAGSLPFNAALIIANADGVNNPILIQNNMIGTNASGTAQFTNVNNTFTGILLQNVGQSIINTNIFSGCTGKGVSLQSCNHVTIENNFIGVNFNGTAAIPNLGVGIVLNDVLGFGCYLNLIQGNVIAGNGSSSPPYQGGGNGIIIGDLQGVTYTSSGGKAGTYSNVITQNTIGGAGPLYSILNTGNGIILADNNNTISQNFISGNGQNGILASSGCSGNTITQNVIGLNGTSGSTPTGTQPVPNFNGIQLGQPGGANTSISNIVQTNYIAGNANAGVLITSYSQANTIAADNIFGQSMNSMPVPNGVDIQLVSSTQTLD